MTLLRVAWTNKQHNMETNNEATGGEVTKNDLKETKAWWVICGN